MNKELLAKLKHKKKTCRKRKPGQVTWEEEKDQVGLHLARDVKDIKKGFHKYIRGRGKTRRDVGQLLSETGDVVTQQRKKAPLRRKCHLRS